MKAEECETIREMANRLIGFILWKGAEFDKKKIKVIHELRDIRNFCLAHVDEDEKHLVKGGGTGEKD